VNILRELRHPHIVRYYDRIIDKAATKLYIVMESCEGGDLGAIIKRAKRDGIGSQPGVIAFLRGLKDRSIPCAVGSSAPLLNVQTGMSVLKTDGMFSAIVSGDDVTRGKPAPDVFLEAARKIAREPGRCLVVEDAHVGLEAALAAGMRALAVTTTHPRESFLESGAARIVDSLAEVDAAAVRELLF
jgi:beta-phosphoglucomutase-like phosphatase (HAD superfamily)